MSDAANRTRAALARYPSEDWMEIDKVEQGRAALDELLAENERLQRELDETKAALKALIDVSPWPTGAIK